MNSENTVLKSELLSLFLKGKSETEAYKEISKTHSSDQVTLNIVSKWFEVFKSEENGLYTKKNRGRKLKFTDEFLINLVSDNPGVKMSELAKLANTSATTIQKRLKNIYIDGESLYYRVNITNKGANNLTDELLIKLVNDNPNINMKELAKITNTSARAISDRLKNIYINEENLYNIVKVINKAKKKFTDEFLINIINENPNFSMEDIAKIANTSPQNISSRIKRINKNSERVKYIKKNASKFNDEYFINLINDNPDLNIKELAKISSTSVGTLTNKIKHINRDGQTINYSKKGSQNGTKKFTDEYLINLIKENPGINTYGLAELAGTSQPTISNRLKQINSERLDGDKITLTKNRSKSKKNSPYITDEYLIKLVDDNPTLNIAELAKLADTSFYNIWKKINQINRNGQKINYTTKRLKFTDEFLIQLINDNPEFNMKELAKLAGTSQSTIINRIKQINNDEQIVCYRNKALSRRKAFTDEFLIKLINENPGHTMEKLGELANVSSSAISKRLKEINMNGERVVYVNKLSK